ncbi:MORN motif family protein [Collimonas arenae]|uniref:MORN motif family protein n=1 Tax=Collimonas arenae TaxID=279058 RepID=A0A0A1F8X6_9BURK|nr:C13 family peptidase [Collimonas arenae]AIY41193.1 MORN motif family protein [Collimonas arenae]
MHGVISSKLPQTRVFVLATAIFAGFMGSGIGLASATPSTPDAVTADGGRYYGPLVDNKRQGKGRVEWANGDIYEGNFDKGLFSGKGKYTSGANFLYEGEYKAGSRTGQGRSVDATGSVYVGHFLNGEFDGQGKLTSQDGSVYEGSFAKGLFNGTGKWTSKDQEYTGEFKNGQFSGKGKLKSGNGRIYTGTFANGHFQGQGRYDISAKEYYAGEFDNDDFTGHGIHQAQDGSRHVGTFKKWIADGPGRKTDRAGNIYEGVFDDGDLNRPGRYIGKDGSRYEGEFDGGKFDGMGIYRNAEGDEYKGGFSYNLFDGGGIVTYAAPQKDGRSKDIGIWRYGKLDNPVAAKLAKINIETALYGQRAMLDKTLAAIAPHQPGKINLYLLAVAGDGSQEVFRRETEFVHKQFDRDFGTQGRSMVLVNSRNTVAEQPMATVTSIRESLNAIAAKMDKENDILFLYLTSHGSQNHELSLAQNGMSLRNLEAKELGKLLVESGIRWKVVVVSACYAGGFIDPLKDDHTMVIAAARSDRTSFGCADDNDFTYFGEAFFQKSLPGSASFEEAFNKAKTLVATWENDDIKAAGKGGEVLHSEPQIHHTSQIDQYLKKWRAQITTVAPAGKLAPTL